MGIVPPFVQQRGATSNRVKRLHRLNQQRFDYRTGILASPLEVDAAEWNALLASQAQPTPFLRHEFLSALETTRCAVADTGWQAQFVTLTDERTGKLAAAAPVYLKGHSYGEYVFDWAWADAYRRNGVEYYPKLLCAVPFTPVQGTRLMAANDHASSQMVILRHRPMRPPVIRYATASAM